MEETFYIEKFKALCWRMSSSKNCPFCKKKLKEIGYKGTFNCYDEKCLFHNKEVWKW
jgi:hypothetical protein